MANLARRLPRKEARFSIHFAKMVAGKFKHVDVKTMKVEFYDLLKTKCEDGHFTNKLMTRTKRLMRLMLKY